MKRMIKSSLDNDRNIALDYLQITTYQVMYLSEVNLVLQLGLETI